MKRIQFSKSINPGVTEVLSPLGGYVPRVHQFAGVGHPNSNASFHESGSQLMKVPQLGYSLETLAFAICAGASFALMLMIALGVI
jgi:hypothetical protein